MAAEIVIIGSFVSATVVECSRFPDVGESVRANAVKPALGGKGFNLAVQAARLGHSVSFIGAVGDDQAADVCIARLADEGVQTQFVRRISGVATGSGVIMRDAQGRNKIAVSPGANDHLSLQDVRRAQPALSAARVVMAQLEIPLDVAVGGLTLAHHAGAKTVLNPAPASLMTPDIAAVVDYLTPNESEVPLCLGSAKPELLSRQVQELARMGPWTVVATRGDMGVLVSGPEQAEAYPAFAVDAIDTTGAGDSFTASFACALAEEQQFSQAIRFASAAAAISVTRHETYGAYPQRSEVDALLSRSPVTGRYS